jgi:protein SCO1/2
MRRKASIAAALALAALPAPAQGPVQRFDPRQEVGIDQRLGESLPLDAVFRDQAGREVALGDLLAGRPCVLALVYYECPMLCTLVLNDLLRAVRAIPLEVGRDFDVIAVSIDPRETAELAARKARQYVEGYGRAGSERGWHFLTGDQGSIDALARAIGFRYVWDERAQQFAHASGVMVATPAGVLSHYFYGLEYPARDLRLALVDAADERIGSPVDQVLLLCLHYDPSTGRYGLAITGALRLGGIATLALLGGFLFVSLRRERRASRGAEEAGP